MNARAAALLLVALPAAVASACPVAEPAREPRILVFTRSLFYTHESTDAGVAAIFELGRKHRWLVDTTEDALRITDSVLKHYRAVVFLNASGNALGNEQQEAFERYIRIGGNFVGIHAAIDTAYHWPWYGRLVGAQLARHPEVQRATLTVVDRLHQSTHQLPARWEHLDAFHNFEQFSAGLRVLLAIDESTDQGGTHGAMHPISWCHVYDGGRVFYTAMGHTAESFADPHFLEHLRGGITYALAGPNE